MPLMASLQALHTLLFVATFDSSQEGFLEVEVLELQKHSNVAWLIGQLMLLIIFCSPSEQN